MRCMLHYVVILICFIASPLCASQVLVRPVIGVSGQAPDSRTVIPIMAVLRQHGAHPIYLDSNKDRDPTADIEKLDGLVIGGNSQDINPADYGESNVHPKTSIETNLKRRNYERAIIELALKKKLPLFGICGGMQRINTNGPYNERGTLIQHVEGENQGKDNIPPYLGTQSIYIPFSQDNVLYSIASNVPNAATPRKPGYTFIENTYHHQAIGEVRKGFAASAYAGDIIEAIEPDPSGPYGRQFAIGVLWHPEFGASDLSPALWSAFVNETQKYAQQK